MLAGQGVILVDVPERSTAKRQTRLPLADEDNRQKSLATDRNAKGVESQRVHPDDDRTGDDLGRGSGGKGDSRKVSVSY